jgi:hypothetical protein
LTFNYPNIGALAKFLEQELVDALADLAPQGAASAAAVAVAGAASCETMGDDLHALSDDELEARLLARLKQTQ